MARIFPFRPLYANREHAAVFTSPSAELTRMRQEGEILPDFCYQQILNPQIFYSINGDEDARLERGKERLQEMINSNLLQRAEAEYFYIYKQEKEGRVFHTIIALCSLGDYAADVIKRHELTRPEREEKMADYFSNVRVNGNPVLIAYPAVAEINKLLLDTALKPAEQHFETSDKAIHTLWKLDNESDSQMLIKYFNNIPRLYIADGHHRSASLARLRPNPDQFMVCLIGTDELKIFGFHRYVKDLNGLSEEAFINAVRNAGFYVERLVQVPDPLAAREGIIHALVRGNWYAITIPEELKESRNAKEKLDVYILDKCIFGEILNISDTRTSDRVRFVHGNMPVEELILPVEGGEAEALFMLHPVAIEDIFNVSDNGETMPPKSTWIEPKMRNGLLIHEF